MTRDERILLSTDPKDPNYRLRITMPADDGGGVELAEEELTSNRPAAQVSEVSHSWIITLDQARWLADNLTDMLDQRGAMTERFGGAPNCTIASHAPNCSCGGRGTAL